jgi:hypothetical protein
MKRRTLDKLLMREMDGTLSDADRKALQAARKASPDQTPPPFEAVGAALDQYAVVEPRDGFTGRVMAKIEHAPVRQSWLSRMIDAFQPVPTIAGTAALGLGVLLAATMNGVHTNQETIVESDVTSEVITASLDLVPSDSLGDQFLNFYLVSKED